MCVQKISLNITKGAWLLMSCSVISFAGWSQANTVSSGGTAPGGNGSATYSVGQVVYEEVSGSNAALIQGVQQPFELFTVNIIESELVSLSVYPNPTVQQLTLSFGEQPKEAFSYALFDYQGRLIMTDQVSEQQTIIDLGECANASYVLHVMDHQSTVAVIEIIKN